MLLTYESIAERPDWWLLHAVTGSHAYGTALPTSDVDTRGVFVLPKTYFYGLTDLPQVSDERNDNVFYELGRFVELLSKNNPNMLELLASPADCIRYQHPLYARLTPELFLSKRCFATFAGYAQTQIRKARGLNKKILNPLARERKGVLDFCFVLRNGGSEALHRWLAREGRDQSRCGLVRIAHFTHTFALYYDESGELGYSGVVHKPGANDVALSSVPPGHSPLTYLSFDLNAYQTYCKDYRQYWEWVDLRNEERFENTLAHGKLYDAKNMLHTFRLLDMAEDIAREGRLHVRRPNRDFLLAIRRGDFDYEQLVTWAEERLIRIERLFAESALPEAPNEEAIERVLVEIREAWYG